ncbi:MAG: hypothetical protein DWC11_07255 [Candidatus Poseidoniales archaeon]|nr:MAG: hypothetical protein DWC11_07255 [Candidatus Poseidoniales archaeon]
MQGRGGRGRRREPLNPFAQNAGAERQRRREENAKRARDAEAQQQRTAATRSGVQNQGQDELRRKAIEAQKALQDKATGTVEVESTVPTSTPASALPQEPVETERERLARLSQENKAAAQSILKANTPAVEAPVVISEATSTVTAAATTVEATRELPTEPKVAEPAPSTSAGTQNIFKQIAIKPVAKTTGQRKRGSRDKKGGGRQKQVKKLNRQKYLEYKYAARDMLADPGVPEEHRSNLLGQIWAKGERISFEAAIEYIVTKESEGILPPTVAADLQRLIKRMETRR